MARVIVAAGSNLGDRLYYLESAGHYLSDISAGPVRKSSVWESEPVGPAKYPFFNTVAAIDSELPPKKLLEKLKRFEQSLGRQAKPQRWGSRILDLDIIAFSNLVIQTQSLIIPHPEYPRRLFVLLPLQELFPEWLDPQHGTTITTMIEKAPGITIQKTELTW